MLAALEQNTDRAQSRLLARFAFASQAEHKPSARGSNSNSNVTAPNLQRASAATFILCPLVLHVKKVSSIYATLEVCFAPAAIPMTATCEIDAQACREGMTSLFHSGVDKVHQGITTYEEVLRATKGTVLVD